ncbi:uncharacterized protein LOC18429609 isoform X2 [Amborella trichopoda]|uniref:uncharacterized protein LOC18429609 isoform X2 n=1 Tax=Amborella trichopoda TaxID=13333 RepID=UPI0009C01E0B|nr:uncharacterized protein LOC18429609 isoform X2 [Amborella trichopoda]|eukprot:XP_020519839.1 uncharacterized protein LOC18429609 isoform X2 [Amborella trichopoda]
MDSGRNLKKIYAAVVNGDWSYLEDLFVDTMIMEKEEITNNDDTILHVAAQARQTEMMQKLLELTDTENVAMKNKHGNTPLHEAVITGSVGVCRALVGKDRQMLDMRNVLGETPLFLAAKFGNKKVLRSLASQMPSLFDPDGDRSALRRDDGHNILHAAIEQESYGTLLVPPERWSPEVIRDGPDATLEDNGPKKSRVIIGSMVNLIKSVHNVTRSTGRKVLTWRFRTSSSDKRNILQDLENPPVTSTLNLAERSPQMSELDGQDYLAERGPQMSELDGQDYEGLLETQTTRDSHAQRLERSWCITFKTSINFTWRVFMAVLVKFVDPILHVVTIALGLGHTSVKELKNMKRRHKLGTLLAVVAVAKLMDHGTARAGTQGPPAGSGSFDMHNPLSPFLRMDKPPKAIASVTPHETSLGTSDPIDYVGFFGTRTIGANHGGFYGLTPIDRSGNHSTSITQKGSDSSGLSAQDAVVWSARDSVLWEATKNGVLEVVRVILAASPDVVNVVDERGRNILHLAVQYRQPHIFKHILKSGVPLGFALRTVDKDGNNLLHLAAKLPEQTNQHAVVQGAALHMQWELEWYEMVKEFLPNHMVLKQNKDHKTPIELFRATHSTLGKQGADWLTKTAKSFSLVTTLISTVCFAAAFTVPGGVKQENGQPVLLGKTPFLVFLIADLVALSFSITSLVMFLAILTSHFQEWDFHRRLPWQLLGGLSTLFISIAAMLVAFSFGLIPLLHGRFKDLRLIIILVPSIPIGIFAFVHLPLYLDLFEYSLRKLPRLSYKDDVL